MHVEELATLTVIFVLAAITPGADLAMILRQSLSHGRRNAIITALGIGVALLVHTTYTVLGLGAIISQSLLLFNLIKWLGVAYLVFIGIKALCAKGTNFPLSGLAERHVQRQPLSAAFMRGFVVNVLNPKAVFFFISIFSTLIAVQTPIGIKFAYGSLMAFIVSFWFILVSIFMTAPITTTSYDMRFPFITSVRSTVVVED